MSDIPYTIPNSLIDKIKKLLALSNSSNEHEATLALTKAKELATQYDLDLATIKVVSEKPKDEPIEKGNAICLGHRKPISQRYISCLLREFFNVRVVYFGGRYSGFEMILVGRRKDIEIAHYVQEFLSREFMTRWHQFRSLHPEIQTKDRGSYLYGLYIGLKTKLRGAQQKTENQHFTALQASRQPNEIENIKTCYALAKIDHQQNLEKKLREFYPNLRKSRTYLYSGTDNIDAHKQGIQDGKQINLVKAVADRSQFQLVQK